MQPRTTIHTRWTIALGVSSLSYHPQATRFADTGRRVSYSTFLQYYVFLAPISLPINE